MSFLTRFRQPPGTDQATPGLLTGDPTAADEASAKESPVEPAPVEQASVEQASVEPAPVEQGPVEPAPVEPAAVEPAGSDEAVVAPDRGRRRVLARVTTVLAALLVFFALIAPNVVSRLTAPGAYLRLPVEGLVGFVLLLVLPRRARMWVATPLGAVLGLVLILKVIDMGFLQVLARPFDPVLDWILFDDAYSFLVDSVGRAGAIGAVVAAVLLAAGILGLVTLSVRRLAKLVGRPRTVGARTVGALTALTAAWVACLLLGVQVVPGVSVAARSTATYAYDRALGVQAGLQDQQKFVAESAVDAFRGTADGQLLTGLRGKDVIFSFVESYGRSAVEDPALAPQVDAVLDSGTRRLAAAGYASRSAFLTSPTFGGGSWLAHATLLSGLWINNQQRYHNLTASDRLTVTSAFRRAGFRTVGVEPGTTRSWPEGQFYGYDHVYDDRTLGYRGSPFSWSTMPDQYTLATFQRAEHGVPGHQPLMAEITLTSSHTPWAPIPRFLPWSEIGDGSVYREIAREGKRPGTVWQEPAQVRAEYRRSIEYSLNCLISYVANYGDQNLVLVFLGDHQPAPIVTGEGASHDVPVTIVARDPAVLDRITGWGWQDGLNPGPQAPVWAMSAFRDRFLTAFGSAAGPTEKAATSVAGRAAGR